MGFEFATADRIVFGPGSSDSIPDLAASLGGRALGVTGSHPDRHRRHVERLEESGIRTSSFSVDREPTVGDLVRGVDAAREAGCDVVVAIGGGSVLDAAKAIAGLLTNPGDPLDYLEVVGRGVALARRAAPLVAVPTTAGTGSEVTRNAVVLSEEHGLKVSMRSPLLLPAAAVVDPLLSASMPPAVTAGSGLDALAHLQESFVSLRASPLIDPLCLDGMTRVARSLPQAFAGGGDPTAREDMSLAGLLGGLALANAGLGAVHGLAGVLGGRFGAPHGMVCGRLLPFVFEANVDALRRSEPRSARLDRFDRIGAAFTGRPEATAGDAVEWLHGLIETLGVPPLSAHGLGDDHIPDVASDATRSSSMRGNPVVLAAADLETILHRAR